MAKATAYSTDLLKLLLNATPIANVADNASSSPLTNTYISLHTASPGVGGSQTTNEVSYTGYARQPVARNNGSPAWTIASGIASPNATVAFPTSSGGTGGTITHFVVGSSVSGTGKIFYIGTVSPNFIISPGVTPYLTPSSVVTEA